MFRAAVYPNSGLRIPRHSEFYWTIGIAGLNLAASQFSFQFRENKETDPPFLSLANAAPGADGITASLMTIDGSPYTTVLVRAAKATVEAIAQPSPIGSDLHGFFGFKIDGNDFIIGKCILEARANHA